ncbi:MAG TPA: hypothetical protein VMB51_12305 [Solirubrobacteraceae bacterium]|nr:hypothetical protein [Solirubrobacteraceae bacterium]
MSWRKPARAMRVAIYEEGETVHHYWRAEDHNGDIVWRSAAPPADNSSADAISTAELLTAIETSLKERRRASRGRRFHL